MARPPPGLATIAGPVAKALLIACLLMTMPATAMAADAPCTGETSAAGVPQKPARQALRFGITPGAQTGQLGSGAQPPRIAEDPAKQVSALHKLRPDGKLPLVLRLHRFFWSDGEQGVQHFLRLADRYTKAGFLVELQLRYHPTAQQEGDIPAWTSFVRHVVDRFGPNRRVVAIQVTNEVNLPFSPDSSDGAYAKGDEALVQGVLAAKDEATKRGFRQLEIGFNWAYRSTPQDDDDFWAYLRDNGGPKFVKALDWIGLDAYPGTFFPPAEAPGRERDGMVNAMSSIRCYAARAGIPQSKPIHIEENGFPTSDSPDRSEQRQVDVMNTLVQAVQDFRGTYNVSDYRWFNLRDGDSTSPNFQVRYGLLHDDYSEKPAFGVYRDLIARLSIRPHLRVRCVRHGWRVSLQNPPVTSRVDFLLDGHLLRRDREAPYRATLPASKGARRRRLHTIAARIPHAFTLQARVHACGRTATRTSSTG
ncbi:MAG: hypothetical protein QOE38_1047 [Thermoleophilaceae bacterium]|nr:hypothetical protein [Thermoleophilaceae bacterium]